MKSMSEFLRGLIVAGSGNSSMRFIAVHSTLVITYIWAFVCIWKREFVDIPMGVIYFAAITIAGKVIQKFPEITSLNNKNGNENNSVKKDEKEDCEVSCDKCK